MVKHVKLKSILVQVVYMSVIIIFKRIIYKAKQIKIIIYLLRQLKVIFHKLMVLCGSRNLLWVLLNLTMYLCMLPILVTMIFCQVVRLLYLTTFIISMVYRMYKTKMAISVQILHFDNRGSWWIKVVCFFQGLIFYLRGIMILLSWIHHGPTQIKSILLLVLMIL